MATVVSFHREHEFPAPAAAVAAGMTDAGFVEGLALPDVSPAEILDRRHDAEGDELRVRYQYVGQLDPIARRIVGDSHIAWVQVVTVQPDARRGTLTIDPVSLHGRVTCNATYALDPAVDGSTLRTLDGELVIRVPVIGRTAERRVLEGVLRRLDIEADALREWLRRDAG
jgi:hypothetical protein